MIPRKWLFFSFCFMIFACCGPALADPAGILNELVLPRGFKISVFADSVAGARSMCLGDKNTLFVGTKDEGKVYAVIDRNNDGRADAVFVIADKLFMPNGVAFRNGSLYVAEVNRVIRFDDIEKRLEDPPEPTVVNDSFPADPWHGWKFIRFGPDGYLYVPVGAPCNVCEKADPRFGSIMRMKPDGTGLEVFAKGIRNSVGFDWDPRTKELWFTDNGRDRMGDNVPHDELNHAPRKGMNFGFPYCHAGDIPDPEFGNKRACVEFSPPAAQLGPHVAALGMRFYTGAMFPQEYRGQIFIALHGSWNRSEPIGYRIMLVKTQGNMVKSYEPFAQGWLKGNKTLGRPVDVQVMPDGALLVSDDFAGLIYRISYEE